MQAMRLLKSSDWTMVAGAVVALSLAVSLSLTLLLARPVRVDASGNFTSPQHRINETVGVAIADNFQHRWQPTDDMPLKPVPRRDPFAGLIGGLLTQPLAQDVPQAKQVEVSRWRAAARAAGRDGATGAANAAIRRLCPTRPASSCVHAKPSPLLALRPSEELLSQRGPSR